MTRNTPKVSRWRRTKMAAQIDRTRTLALAVAVAALLLLPGAAPAKVTGKIVRVDIQARTMTVEDPSAGKLTLAVDEKSVIVLDGDEQATLDDLFEGDDVLAATVRQAANGKMFLVRATVTSQPPKGNDEDPGDREPPPAK